MISYKKDIVNELKGVGINTNKIRKEHLLSEATLQSLRERKYISFAALDTLCKLLSCQPGDLIEYVPYPDDSEK